MLSYRWRLPRILSGPHEIREEEQTGKSRYWKGIYSLDDPNRCMTVYVSKNQAVIQFRDSVGEHRETSRAQEQLIFGFSGQKRGSVQALDWNNSARSRLDYW